MHFGTIAFSRAEFVDARVPAGAIGETFRQFSGELLQRGDTRFSRCVLIMLSAVNSAIAGKEEGGGLTYGVKGCLILAGLARSQSAASQCDRLLGEWTQLFGLRQRRYDTFAQHERCTEIAQQRLPVR